jgi:hypothetical protein
MYKIIFLHHSTGNAILKGGESTFRPLVNYSIQKFYVSKWFKKYNQLSGTNYIFDEQYFPKKGYGWNNYPFDYYNIWVKNAGEHPFMSEPTLEILSKQYDLIIFKHCFPVCDILEDVNQPDINSSERRIENYKLQYYALRQKMMEFPDTKFLVWTGAAMQQPNITEIQAKGAKSFFRWVKNEWDTPNDNIYIFDFFELETEGTYYMKPEFALNPKDPHPNKTFSKRVASLFCERIVEVIKENK